MSSHTVPVDTFHISNSTNIHFTTNKTFNIKVCVTKNKTQVDNIKLYTDTQSDGKNLQYEIFFKRKDTHKKVLFFVENV